jgi:hypothetical protein
MTIFWTVCTFCVADLHAVSGARLLYTCLEAAQGR